MDFLGLVVTAGSGFIGVMLGSWLSARYGEKQRNLIFIEKQLKELYSPLLGIRKEIATLSEYRRLAEDASGTWWKRVCSIAERIKDDPILEEYFDKEGGMIMPQIEYNNAQLKDRLIPAYRQLIKVFKNNYWLAEEDTKQHFSKLVMFVEMWDRILSHTHPREVMNTLRIEEKELLGLYENIEAQHAKLRARIKGRGTMNWSKGFLRAGILASVIWTMCIAVSIGTEYMKFSSERKELLSVEKPPFGFVYDPTVKGIFFQWQRPDPNGNPNTSHVQEFKLRSSKVFEYLLVPLLCLLIICFGLFYALKWIWAGFVFQRHHAKYLTRSAD